MYSFSLLSILVVIFAQSIITSPVIQPLFSHTLKESHPVPPQWTKVDVPSPEYTLLLHIGLKQNRFAELENHLFASSDPSHGRYGQHLSHQEVLDLVRPSQESIDQVSRWLLENGISLEALTYSPAQDWINIALPVSKIESLLSTKYDVYQHHDSQSRLVRTPNWSLPIHLHDHIDTIQPTNSFFRPNAQRSTMKPVAAGNGVMDLVKQNFAMPAPDKPDNQSLAQACLGYITPRCLRTLYGTIGYQPQVPDQLGMGISNYLGETSNRSDARVFLEKLRPDAVSAADDYSIVIIDGGKDEQGPLTPAQLQANLNQEGNLDVQTMLGIAYPIPLTTYNTGGQPPFEPDLSTPTDSNEPYLTYLQYLSSQSDLPNVLSSSYGDDEQTIPPSYAVRVCNTFAQLGARGISFLVASGDVGVGRNGACLSNDGTNTSTFLPDFPATCPWVTAVGGTKNLNPEVAAYDSVNGYSSGGGFSNYFPQPAYQGLHGAIKSYTDSLQGEYNGLYNCEGRAYPDVSAQSQTYVISYGGQPAIVDGTSASTPTVAAIIALVNDALVAAGKPTLGFLNPWLYDRGYKAFTDVLSGSSRGCNTAGFPAMKGWDAVTGFGTPVSDRINVLGLEETNAVIAVLSSTQGFGVGTNLSCSTAISPLKFPRAYDVTSSLDRA